MNKSVIILLALCLISVVHGFVKRDAPQNGEKSFEGFEGFKKQAEDFISGINAELSKALNPEAMKKQLSETYDSLAKTLNQLGNKDAPKA